jgi:hypothetical protein
MLTYLADWRRRQGRGRVELRTKDFELILTNATDAQVDGLIRKIVEEGVDPDS